MYPSFVLPFIGLQIHSFGIFLIIALVIFSYMLQKMCLKLGLNPNFFLGSALAFVVSTFLIARVTFVLLEWRDYSYIASSGVTSLLIMGDYNLSLPGGILGFILVLCIKLRRHAQKANKYIDAVVVAFLLASVVGFIGAFFGGQIYGAPTSLPIGLVYSETSSIPYTSAVLPLSLLYALGSFVIFSALYISKEFLKISGAIGYIGLSLFCLMMLVGEFFSGNSDIIREYSLLGFTQILALVGVFISGFWLFRQIRSLV